MRVNIMIKYSLLRKAVLISCLVCAGIWGPGFAQTDSEGQESGAMKGNGTPPRWLTMEQVENIYGTPINKSVEIGDPPISWWEYENYDVYFERNRVLHTVMKP